MRACLISCCALLSTTLAFGQERVQVGVPTMGVYFDRSQAAFRTLRGIPGAAIAEDSIEIASKFKRARVARDQTFAVGASDEGMALIRFDRPGSATYSFGGVVTDAEFCLSPLGKSAAFHTGDVIRVFTGLPENSSAHHEVRIPNGASLLSLAVSDDASYLLAVVTFEDGRAVAELFDGANEKSAIKPLAATSVEFFPDSHDYILVDRDSQRVSIGRQQGSTALVTTLLDADLGMSLPIFAATSLDGKTLFVANSGDQSVLAYDMATGATASRSCNCSVQGLYPLAGNAVFRVTDSEDPAIWLVDMNRPELRISFAGKKETQR